MKTFFKRPYLLLSSLFFLHNNSYSQCGTPGTTDLTVPGGAATIVNTYYPGTGNPASGATSLTVGARNTGGSNTALANGDMILIIQMQGADINSSNSDSYGDGVAGGTASGYLTGNLVAGLYEYNIVTGFSSNTVTLQNPLVHSYYSRSFSTTTGTRTYQVIRVPRYKDITVPNNRSITAPAWNGSSGGVIVLEASGTINLNGTNAMVNANALGFRGGGGKYFDGVDNGNTNGSGAITRNDYRWNSPRTTAANQTGGAKGEGIAGTPVYYLTNGAGNAITNGTIEGYIDGAMGRGAPGNAGGGGTDGDPASNQYNPGGGGGGNGGAGGKGGSGWDGGNANAATYNTGGFGGAAFAQASLQRLVLGGGGGAGTSNNSEAGETDFLSSGACGGGIVIMRAKSYSGSGLVRANGANANDVNDDEDAYEDVTDAAGGGGAGGTIIIVTNEAGGTITNTIRAQAFGGDGGNMENWFAHGPGGGGGGGFVITNVVADSRINVNGGANGLTRSGSQNGDLNNTYNAAPGAAGRKVAISGPVGFLNPAEGSHCGILPVTLHSWKGVYNNNKTYLNWQTDAGFNFSHFVVEHSTDGARFSALAQVAAVVSNALMLQYSYVDALPASGINYYRLKMVDKDGQFTYSAIITIRTDVKALQVSVSPNPFNNHVVIAVQSNTDEAVQFRVFNSDGKLVWRKTSFVTAGNNAQYFSDLQSLPRGMYILKVNKKETVSEFKLIKQ
jgi:hypothetical protein